MRDNGITKTVLAEPISALTGAHERANMEFAHTRADIESERADMESERADIESAPTGGNGNISNGKIHISSDKKGINIHKNKSFHHNLSKKTVGAESISARDSKGGEPQLIEEDIFKIVIPLVPESVQDSSEKTVEKTTQKTTQKILELIKSNPYITRKEIAQEIGNITEDGIKYHLAKLKKDGKIKRIGPDKGGYWEVRE